MDDYLDLPYKISDNVTILKCAWFNGKGSIGIVIVEVEPKKELKAYISNVPGHHEKADAKIVAEWGGTFPLDVALKLFGIKA